MIINPGFKAKRDKSNRLPPGQYETTDFPVLSLGPTPQISKNDFSIKFFGLIDKEIEWSWEDIQKQPIVDVKTDIHCVTKWSKFDTKWQGVSIDYIIEKLNLKPDVTHVIAYSYDGYTTNIPLSDIQNNQAWIAVSYDNKDIESAHGGPVRLLVPHLYFWKSAKWLRGIEFTNQDKPGFWETRGYHNYGDPWKEERYSFDD